jgi:hypothetical protein
MNMRLIQLKHVLGGLFLALGLFPATASGEAITQDSKLDHLVSVYANSGHLFRQSHVEPVGLTRVTTLEKNSIATSVRMAALPATSAKVRSRDFSRQELGVAPKYWGQECYTYWRPGYTDRDWDEIEVCEWVWYEDEDPDVCEPGLGADVRINGDGGSKTLRVSSEAKLPNKDINDAGEFKVSGQSNFYSNLGVIQSQLGTYGQFDYRSKKGAPLLSAMRTLQTDLSSKSYRIGQNFGVGWYGSWDRSISVDTDNRARITRGNGQILLFKKGEDGSWKSIAGATAELIQGVDSSGNSLGWTLRSKNNVEVYDSDGKLKGVILSGGHSYELTYSMESEPLLLSVTELAGRSLVFKYDDQRRVKEMLGPDAYSGVTYSYDASNRLTAVSYFDGRKVNYHYGAADDSFALSFVSGETGQVLLAIERDEGGTVVGTNFPNALKSNSRDNVPRLPRAKQSCPMCTPEKLADISDCLLESTRVWGDGMIACQNDHFPPLGPIPLALCFGLEWAKKAIRDAQCTSRYPECF